MTDSSPDLRAAAEAHLRALAGEHARLRDDQWTAISALVTGRRRVLVVQRTGWGKSAVYFVATALLRARGAGPTVIVSPLLALMRNQVEAAVRASGHDSTVMLTTSACGIAATAVSATRPATTSKCSSAANRSRRPSTASAVVTSLANGAYNPALMIGALQSMRLPLLRAHYGFSLSL